MAIIAPLTPLRYDLSKIPGGLGAVVAPPYDVIDADARAVLAARHPRNIVHLILPEGEGDSKYAHAATLFNAWCAEGTLQRDSIPGFYTYAQTFVPPGQPGRTITRRGFLALVRLSPFSERQILPHERTLSGPKEDRLKLFRSTRTNLSPGFMLYRDPQRTLDAPLSDGEPLCAFDTPDGVHHALSKVTRPEALRAIVEGVAASALLIADGHHRYETAVRYRDEVESRVGGSDPLAEHRYFMAFLANGDDPNLVVFPTHRLVHSLPHFDFATLLEQCKALFSVKELPRNASPAALKEALATASQGGRSFVVVGQGGLAAALTLKAESALEGHGTVGAYPEVLRRTDVVLLHAGILESILGITKEAQAAKTNIQYVQEAEEALASLARGQSQVLFLMNATPVHQVREAAEAGEVMPQKSTFFYPKVLTGLTVHTLDPARRVAGLAGT